METHVVDAVFATFLENLHPRFLVGWRIARLGEAAVFNGASKPDGMSVHIELSAIDGDVSHAELRFVNVVACINGEGIDHRGELIPCLHTFPKVEREMDGV